MPASLILDVIDGSELETGTDLTRYVRAGYIRDIETGDDQKLLYDAMNVSGMPAMGSAFSVDRPLLLFQRLRVNAVGPSTARVALEYETRPFTGGTTSAWIVRDSGRVHNEMVNKVPGLGTGIFVGFQGTDPGSNPARSISVPPRAASIECPMGIREVSATALVLGTPAGAIQNWVGYVNLNPFYSKPRGYWLCVEAREEFSRYEGHYTIGATILSRNFTDWSEWAWLKDERTGRIIADQVKVAAAAALPYDWGIINGDNLVAGFARVGPKPMVDFAAAFTF